MKLRALSKLYKVFIIHSYMKKRFLFLFFMFAFISISHVVSAQNFYNLARDMSDAMSSVLGLFFGDAGSTELLFIKFLVFLLIIVAVRYALSRMPGLRENRNVVSIISIIVALLAIRYITSDALVNFIWLPYGVLGVALASFLPFVIFFFFIINIDSDMVRRVGWVTFIVIYFALAILRRDDLNLGGAWWQNLAWLYFIIALISLLSLIFDGRIRRRVIIGMIRRGEDTHNLVLRNELQQEVRRIDQTLANPGLSRAEVVRLQEERRRLLDAIARIH